MTEHLLHKINIAEGLTDAELDEAIEWFADLERKLFLLGPEFRLAHDPISNKLCTLNGFKYWRSALKDRP